MENRVRQCREFFNERNPDCQLNQADVARMLGMTPQGYSKIESGKTVPKVDTAIRKFGTADSALAYPSNGRQF